MVLFVYRNDNGNYLKNSTYLKALLSNAFLLALERSAFYGFYGGGRIPPLVFNNNAIFNNRNTDRTAPAIGIVWRLDIKCDKPFCHSLVSPLLILFQGLAACSICLHPQGKIRIVESR